MEPIKLFAKDVDSGDFEELKAAGGGLFANDFMLQIALGNVSGYSHINKFGHNSVIDTNTDPEDVWDGGGLYVPPTAARIHQFASTDANDAGTLVHTGTITTTGDKFTVTDTSATFQTDSVAVGDAYLNDTAFDHSVVLSIDSETQLTLRGMHDGQVNTLGDTYRIVKVAAGKTGMAVAHIKNGLDADFDFQGEFIIMNGTTNVPTVGAYVRMNRVHSDLIGSNQTNVGTITATADTDGTVTAQINPGNSQTLMAHYTVPRNKVGFIVAWDSILGKAGGTAGASAETSLRFSKFAPINTVCNIIQSILNPSFSGNSAPRRDFRPYKIVKEYTDIFARIDYVSANASHITAEFDIILVDL